MRLERVAAVAACAVVAAGIVLAFRSIGSPAHARLVALDYRRERDLAAIASRISDRYGDEKTLPARLNDLAGATYASTRDPATGKPYDYRTEGGKRYELCAVFALPSERGSSAFYDESSAWKHGAGRTCYTFGVTSSEPQGST